MWIRIRFLITCRSGSSQINFSLWLNVLWINSVVDPDPVGSVYYWLSWIRKLCTDLDPDPAALKMIIIWTFLKKYEGKKGEKFQKNHISFLCHEKAASGSGRIRILLALLDPDQYITPNNQSVNPLSTWVFVEKFWTLFLKTMARIHIRIGGLLIRIW